MDPRLLFTTGMAVLLTGATACSGSAAQPNCDTDPAGGVRAESRDARQRVTVEVSDEMTFAPCNIVVEAGQVIEVTLSNRGQGRHDFTLSEGVPDAVKITAEDGETATGSFTLDEPGTYSFSCSIPGHAMGGMKGTITAL